MNFSSNLYFKNEYSKTFLLEDYVNFVDSTTKQIKRHKINIYFFIFIESSFLIFVSFKYPKE